MDAAGEQMLEVDGERFRVRVGPLDHHWASTHYDWLSGPVAGYGFSVGGPVADDDEHARRIREFLAEIDPSTGHLRD